MLYKLFSYSKLSYKEILQMEFKFIFFNLGKKYDGSSYLYDDITNW